MNYYGFSKTQAIYDVCRKLKIRITKLDTIKDPAGKTRLKRLDLSKGSVRNKVLQVTNNDDLAFALRFGALAFAISFARINVAFCRVL